MTRPGGVADAHIDTVREFNRFYTRKIGVLGGGLLDGPYSLTEVRVLYEIANRDDALASDLVRDLGVDAGYLSRILAAFQKRAWLDRERSESDARKSHLRLTSKGRKLFASLDRRARRQVGELLGPLSSEQQEQLRNNLQNVEALLNDKPRTADIVLREHQPGDMGWIIQRHGALYASEYGWNEEFEALVAEIGAKFLRSFDPSGERGWIAQRNGLPVGCVMLVRHSRTVAKLRLLLVEPTARGAGVGLKLVAECVDFARRAGYRTVTLWTQSILTAARRIYEAAGFHLVKSEPHSNFGAKLVGETWELSFPKETLAKAGDRRGRLRADEPTRGEPLLSARLLPLRSRLNPHHHEQGRSGMARRARRRRGACHRDPRPAAAPLPRPQHQRPQLPASRARTSSRRPYGSALNRRGDRES